MGAQHTPEMQALVLAVVAPADMPRLKAIHDEAHAMLDVLERVAARWDKDDDSDAPELGADIRAVIARAKGEST